MTVTGEERPTLFWTCAADVGDPELATTGAALATGVRYYLPIGERAVLDEAGELHILRPSAAAAAAASADAAAFGSPMGARESAMWRWQQQQQPVDQGAFSSSTDANHTWQQQSSGANLSTKAPTAASSGGGGGSGSSNDSGGSGGGVSVGASMFGRLGGGLAELVGSTVAASETWQELDSKFQLGRRIESGSQMLVQAARESKEGAKMIVADASAAARLVATEAAAVANEATSKENAARLREVRSQAASSATAVGQGAQ
eukprot:COSAG01_NODE_20359_length_958_cov_0.989523_1_plen_259_part_10